MKRFCKTPIAVFDSGLGGLSVLKELEKLMESEHYIYYADMQNLPYGNKTPEDIIKFNHEILTFFITKGVKHVVMACNTSSALAYDVLSKEFPQLKIYPLIQSVAPHLAKYDEIAVLATEATVKSGKYAEEIKKYNKKAKVHEVACDGFVEIVENGLYDLSSTLELVDSKLEQLPEADKIVLGCTHYPYLLGVLEKFIPREMFLDPAKLFAQSVFKDIEKEAQGPIFELGKKEFYTNGDVEKFVQNAKVFYDVKGEVQKV
jgi:glutamate racemase